MKTKKTTLQTSASAPKSRLDIIKDNRLNRVSFGSIKKRRIQWKKVRKVALILLGVLLIVGVIGGLRVLAYIQDLDSKLPSRDSVFAERPIASEISDRTGNVVLRRLFNEYNSDPLDIVQVPETVKWSFLAAEDSEFYSHQGFDPAAILRCGIASIRAGGVACGGSTITQQLVKITAPEIGSSVSVERKVKELLMSIRVEQQSDKDEILEMYLRVAPFGSNIYGLRTASNFYFGKEPKDLSLAQSTVLAAVIQDPIRLSPTLGQNKEEIYCRLSDGSSLGESDLIDESGNLSDKSGNAVIKAFKYKCRQLYILGQMSQKKDRINGQIRNNYDDPEKDDTFTDEIIEAARIEELKFSEPKILTKAGHFVDYVMDALTKKNYKNGEEPFTVEELQKGGYRIETTLDYQIQQIAEGYVQTAMAKGAEYNMNNSALMTTIPGTGEIIAMAGSKSYTSPSEGCNANGASCKFNGQVNIFRTLQSPGSMNKPVGYYIAFKEGKLFTKSVLPDIPFDLIDGNGGTYTLKNWNSAFIGMGSAEDMLRASRNLPAIEVIQLIGVDNYIKTAREWGYTTYTGQEGPSVILGGADIYGDEHAQAMSVFANNGDIVKLNPILKITDKNGKVIYQATPERKTVGDPQAVYLINQTLKNLDGMSWDQRELAGKTGTSEDSRDAWMTVWSPDFVTLAWGGNNNNEPMGVNAYPPNIIQPWLREYLRDIGGSPYLTLKTPFTRPGFVYEGGGDCNADGDCLGLGRGWLINDRNPPRDIKQVKVQICTDQRDKLARPIDIAMGKAVEATFNYYKMPVAQYQSDLDRYLRENTKPSEGKFPNGGVTDPCTIDRSGGTSGPFFLLNTVDASAGSSIHISGGVYSTNGNIINIQFLLDNLIIPSCTTTTYDSFDITCTISGMNLDEGKYEFKARATDSNSVTNTSSITIINVGDAITSSIVFEVMPPPSLTYGTTVGPLLTHNIDIKYNTAGKTLNNVQIYQVRTVGSDSATSLLGSMTSIGGGKFRYSWGAGVPNENASYKFFIRSGVTSSTAQLESGQSSSVNVAKNP